jgi:3-phosphoshikimate 1-carboxyvinyltransferase
MTELRVIGGAPLRGHVSVPGDKSISHRALILAALAPGTSSIAGLSDGDDVQRTRAALEQLGASILDTSEHAVRVNGGLLREAPEVLDVGNSGTSIRLLAGVCAGLPFLTVLEGDRSLATRPMDRVAEPLRLMGATVDGRDQGRYPPLVIRGGELTGISYDLPVPSAQVKSAILLAGLGADGPTEVHESVPTRAHTEELLAAAGVEVVTHDGTVALTPGVPDPIDLEVTGDPSQAAFWAVAGSIVPGSALDVGPIYVGPARLGFVDVLRRMGAELTVDPETGILEVSSSALVGTTVTADEVPSLIDEIPALAVAAAAAEGSTRFCGVGELRVKESDRIRSISAMVAAFGGRVESTEDELVIQGASTLRAGEVDAMGDHRIAMAGAIAALAAEGESRIEGWEATVTSYPRFESDLHALGPDGRH